MMNVMAMTQGVILYETEKELVLRVGKEDRRITYTKDTEVLEIHSELYHCEVIAEDGADVDLDTEDIIKFMKKEYDVLAFRQSHGLRY